jgi:hypothetical protein
MLTTAVAVLALCGSAYAQPVRQSESCAAAENRQLDFLVGRWSAAYMRAPDRPVGVDTYELAHGGCVLIERWTGEGDQSGIGLKTFDRTAGVWRHVWTDAQGSWVALDGQWRDGAMQFEGEIADSAGPNGRLRARLIIEPLPDGAVRQTYSTSPDGDAWTLRYRLLLVRS